ncbi:hypothetical protein OBBRIDRAFT_738768 [Obba rivulosa]|uniref:Myb-like domain-containing protein n=1 Tax=Obba rivulosa TaxID=1052685 RepID=A0A8E2AK45_9APHY|nr:hypothetical protein OBBRIDRAFT_738768 [Obba rivulosa]
MQPPQAAETHLHVLGQAASSVIDSEHARLALNTESVVKTTRPRRKTTRDYSEQDTEGSEPQVGTRRKRKAKSVDGPVDAAISTEGVEQPSRKRRSKKQIAPDNQPEPLEGEHYIQEGQARRASTAPRRSRTRQPSLPPFDPDADPGAELDPTATTMAALCNDTGQGRVSTKAAQIVNNHIAWRAANREKRARLKAAMEAKKYGRNVDEEESGANAESQENNAGGNAVGTAPGPSAVTSRSVSRHPSTDGGENDGGENDRGENTGDDFDYTQNLNTSRFNVQVRIGPNGETIIDEDSLFVNRDEEQDTADYTHVEESDTTKFVNSSTYSKKVRGSRWSAEETELFYDALSQFGENYELISYVLPGRDRKACKNKFKAEDKKDPARITYCLTHRRPYDIATLSRMTGKDFSGPTPEIRAPTPLRSIELDTNRPEEPSTSPKRVVQKKSKTSGTGDDVEVLGDLEDIEKAGLDESLFDSL